MIRSAVILGAEGGADPLDKLLGLSLVERIILTLGRNGVTSVYVADEALGKTLSGNRDYEDAGIDLQAGQLQDIDDHLQGPVLVARANHVYSDDVIQLAATSDMGAADLYRCGGLLATTTSRLENLDDSDAEVLDVGDAFWHQIDGRAARRRAEKDVLRSLIKPVDGPVAKHIIRRFSLPVTRQLAKTSITPNQITIFATLWGVAGAWFIFQATWQSLAIGGVLIFIQSLFDHNDGEISRLKFKGSEIGRWLDHVSDDILSTVYGLAFGWAAAVLYDEPFYWWLGIGSAIGISIFHLVHYAQLAFVNKSGDPFRFRWWFQKDDLYLKNELGQGSWFSRIAEAFHACGRRDVYVFSYMIFALTRIPQAAVIWYFTVASVHAILAVVHVAAGGMRQPQGR